MQAIINPDDSKIVIQDKNGIIILENDKMTFKTETETLTDEQIKLLNDVKSLIKLISSKYLGKKEIFSLVYSNSVFTIYDTNNNLTIYFEKDIKDKSQKETIVAFKAMCETWFPKYTTIEYKMPNILKIDGNIKDFNSLNDDEKVIYSNVSKTLINLLNN